MWVFRVQYAEIQDHPEEICQFLHFMLSRFENKDDSQYPFFQEWKFPTKLRPLFNERYSQISDKYRPHVCGKATKRSILPKIALKQMPKVKATTEKNRRQRPFTKGFLNRKKAWKYFWHKLGLNECK